MPKQTFFNLPEEKRNLILDLAIEEFAENDYPQASISKIVERAGIAKGSFYQYFDDKRDLFLFLLELAAQEKMALLRGAQPPDPQMGLFDYLKWLLTGNVQFQFSRPRLAQVGYRAVYGEVPFRSQVIDQLKTAAGGYYRELVALGKAQGDIDPDIDDDMAAFVLSAVFNEFGNYLMRRMEVSLSDLVDNQAGPVLLEQLLEPSERLLDILKNGLGPSGRSI